MTGQNFNKMTEQEIEFAKGEQRAYIREHLNGTEYFFKRAGLDREQVVGELGVEITEFGFNKEQLDKNIEERNAAIQLYAIEHDLSSIMDDSEEALMYQRQQDNHRNLREKMDFLGMVRGNEVEEVEEVPLTEHEQVLQKIEELKNQNLNPGQKALKARDDLKAGINKLMGYN